MYSRFFPCDGKDNYMKKQQPIFLSKRILNESILGIAFFVGASLWIKVGVVIQTSCV